VLSETGAPALGLHRVYAQAVASNVFNPKIAIFFLAYLPQFADPTSGGGVALLQRSRSVGLDPHAREPFKAT
jgi:threonine/homoserine/homoserine lactone efflux protein